MVRPEWYTDRVMAGSSPALAAPPDDSRFPVGTGPEPAEVTCCNQVAFRFLWARNQLYLKLSYGKLKGFHLVVASSVQPNVVRCSWASRALFVPSHHLP